MHHVIHTATPLPSSELQGYRSLRAAFNPLLRDGSEIRRPDNTADCFAPKQTTEGQCNDVDNRGDTSTVSCSTFDVNKLDDSGSFARLKAHIVAHPLYEQLFVAHVACLRVAIPSDHNHHIDASLATRENIAAHYLMTAGINNDASADEKHDLDNFMVRYILLLQSFEERLREHLNKYASKAIAGCLEVEKQLYNLTGATSAGSKIQDLSYTRPESPLALGAQKTILEHLQTELKRELKQNYAAQLKTVRQEIVRKRRAGKLPENTTSMLKDWWNAHSKWPYPTEEDKATLAEETGLQLKQINNWFINQRKRNWQTQSSPIFLCEKTSSNNNQVEVSSLSLNTDMQAFLDNPTMQDESFSSAFQYLEKE